MVTAAWSGAGDADAIALLIDARKGLNDEAQAILTRLSESTGPKVLILNTVEPPSLLGLARDINSILNFDQTFMISALNKHGLTRLSEALGVLMPPGPWLYPEDQITDAPLRAFAAEVTREKMFERLHDELPYQTTVETDQWKELPDGSVRIEQTIFVTRDSHKKIVLGEGGRTVKSIGKAARLDIAEAAETPVHLFLFVKVRENWTDDPERYREMGLEFPREA